MRKFIFCLFFGFLFISATKGQLDYQLTEGTTITVHGKSTLHDWKAVVPKYESSIQATEALSGKKLKPEAIFKTATLKFDVESMDGGRGPSMNQKIKTALKSTEHPQIVFELTQAAQILEITDKSQETFSMEVKGNLSLAGSSNAMLLLVNGQRMDDGRINLKASIPLKMSDFNIEPPSAMFGQIVTKDEIEVAFDLYLKSKN